MTSRRIEPLLWRRRLRELRVTMGASVLVQACLAPSLGPWLLLASLGLLVPVFWRRAMRWARWAAMATFVLLAVGLVIALRMDPSTERWVVTAMFLVGLPAFGGIGAPVGAALAATTAVACLWGAAGSGTDLASLGGVLVAGVAFGAWVGTRNDRLERRDLWAKAGLQDVVERLSQQARTDPLTGLSNRMHVQGWLEEAWERSRASDQCLSVLVIDIDRFKSINDAHGHPAGDEVIRQVAQAIGGAIRGADLAGRWGGEEFVVVLWSCPDGAVHEVAERVRAAVEALRVRVPEGTEVVRPTVSIGAATWRGSLEQLPHRLLAEADRALYAAKRDGRNRVRLQGDDSAAAGGLS